MKLVLFFLNLTIVMSAASCTSNSDKTYNRRSAAEAGSRGLENQNAQNSDQRNQPKNNNCSLDSRISMHTIDLKTTLSVGKESAYLHEGSYSRDWYNFAQVLSVITKQNANGRTIVGWQDSSGNAHISLLSKDLQSIEGEVSFPSKRLRDVFFDDKDITTLALEGSRMVLRKYSHSFELQWKKIFLIRDYSSAMHNGRIVKRPDGGYAAYFGVHGMGRHEGDALQQLTESGEYDSNGKLSWTWGCSHSIDQRLLLNGDKLMPICIGDYYPAGLTQRATGRSKVVSSDIKHKNGLESPNLGGTVEYKDHFVSVLSSAYGRQNRDIALVAFEKNAPYKTKGRVWLTDTSTNEVKPKITVENDELIVLFHPQNSEKNSYEVKKLTLDFSNESFSINEKASESVDLEIGPMEDLVSFNHQRPVIAARAPGEPTKLLIQTVEACK
jgi:hypothetical protein